MIIDINRHDTKEIFCFKNSSRKFISCKRNGRLLFMDWDSRRIYTRDEILGEEGLTFYRDDEDEDFLGVDICSSIIYTKAVKKNLF